MSEKEIKISKLFLKNVMWGIISSLLLFTIYYLVLILINGYDNAIEQFLLVKNYIIILLIGFAIQVSLFLHIWRKNKETKEANKAMASTGALSGGTMLLCCMHRLVDFLPFLGLTVLSLFFTKYQVSFLIVGILSNLFGILFMLYIIQRHKMHDEGSFDFIFKFNLKSVLKSFTLISVIIIIYVFISPPSMAGFDVSNKEVKSNVTQEATNIIKEFIYPAEQNKEANKLTINVLPLIDNFDKNLEFEVNFNTHVGVLDFDPIEVTILYDELGNEYKPYEWDGPGPSGHHRSGKLKFQKLKTQPKKLTMKFMNVYNVPVREFEWKIN